MSVRAVHLKREKWGGRGRGVRGVDIGLVRGC